VLWCADVVVLTNYAMSLTEEVDGSSKCHSVNVDAGCTPKLSRRRSVANDCGKRVVEILTKRTPGLSHRPSSSANSSSWLRTVRKSRGTSKQVVGSRKKLCSLQLPFDTEPFRTKHPAYHAAAGSSHGEANSPCCEKKIPFNAHLKVCRCMALVYHWRFLPTLH